MRRRLRTVTARATIELRPAGIAVALCAVLISGCGPETGPREPVLPAEQVDGYAYTAPLVARHPLWRALERMEQALYELSDDGWVPALQPRERRFEQVIFLESYAFADPEERLSVLRGNWRARYPAIELDYDDLSADLLARIGWERDRAEEMVRRRLARAEAEESARLAGLRAQMVRQYQERLTNLRIDSQIRDAETASAAERERERVWELIEAQMEAERIAGRELLEEMEAQLRAEAQRRVEAARARADAILTEREQLMRQAGEDLYAEMIEAMESPWPDTGEGTVSAEADAAEANVRLDAMQSLRLQAEQARQEKIELQRSRMLRDLARLRAQLKSGTETAALVVAYRRGINLHLLPGAAARGDDYTRIIAEELEEFWRVGEDQRS